jgi:dolichol-phosphate mannosyltransferase
LIQHAQAFIHFIPQHQNTNQTQTLYGPEVIQIHQRPGKMGLGSAYMDGLALVRGDLVVLMDADLSHHPKFIPALYRCVLA